MYFEHDNQGIRTRNNQSLSRRNLLGLMSSWAVLGLLVASGTPALADEPQATATCIEIYEPNASYPALPATRGADVVAEAGLMIYLQYSRAVVEIDGCLYQANRDVIVDFEDLDFVTVLLELPDHAAGATVFVTRAGKLVEKIDVSGSMFSYVMTSEGPLGFEIATPGQALPTVPVVVTKPSNPED
jgi:hypothetical protein